MKCFYSLSATDRVRGPDIIIEKRGLLDLETFCFSTSQQMTLACIGYMKDAMNRVFTAAPSALPLASPDTCVSLRSHFLCSFRVMIVNAANKSTE